MIKTRAKGKVDSSGAVVIRFNDANGESLVSADNRYKALPCDRCGDVYWVGLIPCVVSFICDPCVEKENEQ